MSKATPAVHARGQAPAKALAVPEHLRNYLENTLGQIDKLSGDQTSLWSIAERGLQMETAGKILAGRAFIELRSSLQPGEIAAELGKRLIARSSFYKAIEVYELFSTLPDLRVVQALAQLGITKALAIKDWTKSEQLALVTGKEVRGVSLDSIVEMSHRDLDSHLKDWQAEHDDQIKKRDREIADLKTRLDTVTNIKNQLARAGAALQVEEDLPHFALVVRQESMALTQSMSFALDNLQAISEENLFAQIKHPEVHKYQPVAAGTLYFALAGIHARSQQLLQRIQKTFGDAATGMLTNDHQLTAAEIKRFVDTREQLLATHQGAAKKRDDARENSRPGKRGAKRK